MPTYLPLAAADRLKKLCHLSVHLDLSNLSVAEWIKCSGKLPGEEVRKIEQSRLRIVKLGLRREKAHGDTIERPYGSTGVRMINSI